MSYPFSLVLHTHLPMVVNHGRWPHGSDWLNEATFECYLPLLETAHRLVADGISPKWTINLSPVLTEQLASPEFQKELAFYYENTRRACADSREWFGSQGQPQMVALTWFWEEFYERMWELHRRVGGDITIGMATDTVFSRPFQTGEKKCSSRRKRVDVGSDAHPRHFRHELRDSATISPSEPRRGGLQPCPRWSFPRVRVR